MSSTASNRYWLLKAEPDSRIVKGKDVKFSVDDFEHVRISPWEGVRNYEARNLMKEMKEGDQALFYHSNCKNPGIAAFAQVAKEAYPDYTAWDPSHPYYDPKSDEKNPRWFMVDLAFKSKAPHFVPLSLLRKIADAPASQVPDEVSYLGEEGAKAIKGMDLVTRGRLSVQRVEENAWLAITQLAEKGGWEESNLKPTKKGKEKKPAGDAAPVKSKKSAKRKTKDEASDDEGEGEGAGSEPEAQPIESRSGVSASTKRQKREGAGKEPTACSAHGKLDAEPESATLHTARNGKLLAAIAKISSG
ncbi:PUA-like domain-containing protein [Gymnopilus junonius]|uniref:PUA-like domain-containing protein n=1 Tax=Gymnopilus junonius TaxID=109634 RepID=A0A9P5NE69_GYMJU|nr:PUA-like domain-containing protein [Gymnopilus junonius]